MGKQHTTTKVITASFIGAAGFMFAGSLQASAKTITVKSGDTVWKLANKYGVSVGSIEKANHLSKDTIFAGQKIVLGSSATNHTVKANASAKQVKASSNTQVTTKKTAVSSQSSSTKTTATASTYKVKSGDTLSKISAKYGITVSQLQSLNHLKGDTIFTGQKLTVKGTASKVKATSPVTSTVKKTTTAKRTAATTTSAAKATTSTSTKQSAVKTPKAKKTVKADAAGAPVTSVTSYAVKLASQKIPYVWGGSSLRGMDCSGFTSYVYAHTVGTALPHNTVAQEAHVSMHAVSQAVPGDLLFWGPKGASYHVAIYIGNNQYVAAPEPGENVQIQSMSAYFKPSFAGTVK
ncbi:LysM peptidoglycan-binding domain-containing protein [Lactobacillus sp. LC28-10]|uniref:LysM peptidoglycan-binding domain-containing protein n=1 Tax=Secundilactobacillus angelensis TaxID=2722706 RepID=A0ABX1L0H3_9LACO|nr:C40 family peptidase [Secundilactobacillus angelensis]MCH5463102.1 LysM peptidoglycan-binding domain-containing protein [Secundilactobacillus angelensis]NLR18955.1 LysM peptidoglycan-binding domain-containing protein [Secundilactobacillus angelensis]